MGGRLARNSSFKYIHPQGRTAKKPFFEEDEEEKERKQELQGGLQKTNKNPKFCRMGGP